MLKTFDIDIPDKCSDCKFWHIGIASMEFKCILNKTLHDISFEIRDEKKAEWCPLNNDVVKFMEKGGTE